MCCPCGVCKNNKSYSDSKDIHLHLFKHGFMSGYNCWTKHGERGVLMEENEEDEDDDSYTGFQLPEYGGTMGNRMKNKRKNKKVKKRHHMSPMMSFAVSLLMHREDAKAKGR